MKETTNDDALTQWHIDAHGRAGLPPLCMSTITRKSGVTKKGVKATCGEKSRNRIESSLRPLRVEQRASDHFKRSKTTQLATIPPIPSRLE